VRVAGGHEGGQGDRGGAFVLTIDGPSGAGKGTVARRVAEALGFHLLDSGALYRLLALAALRRGVDLADAPALAALAQALDVDFRLAPGGEGVEPWLAGENVQAALRTEECGRAASLVAALPAVRAALLERQRAFAAPPGLVGDGRDLGTVVFPAADLKVFLTASPAERARRRHNQLKQQGVDVNLADLERAIEERDRLDRERPVAPLLPAVDAVAVDTTGVPVAAVVVRILDLARSRLR